MINGRKFFDLPVKVGNVREILKRCADDYTNGCLLDYLYLKKDYHGYNRFR